MGDIRSRQIAQPAVTRIAESVASADRPGGLELAEVAACLPALRGHGSGRPHTVGRWTDSRPSRTPSPWPHERIADSATRRLRPSRTSSIHPLRVMLHFRDSGDQIVAVLHDVVEDTDLEVDDLSAAGYPAEIVAAIDSITHRGGESYEDYIERVAENSMARRVNVIDLQLNLANNRLRPDAPGNAARIAKYERALARLGETA